MTETELYILQERFRTAVRHLVAGAGSRHERLEVAVSELHRFTDLCYVLPSEFGDTIKVQLPKLLVEQGRRLNALTVPEQEELALNLWAIQQTFEEAMARRRARVGAAKD